MYPVPVVKTTYRNPWFLYTFNYIHNMCFLKEVMSVYFTSMDAHHKTLQQNNDIVNILWIKLEPCKPPR